MGAVAAALGDRGLELALLPDLVAAGAASAAEEKDPQHYRQRWTTAINWAATR